MNQNILDAEINLNSVAINSILHHSMAAETAWISVILAPTWKQVKGFSYCFSIKFNELLSQYDSNSRIFTVVSDIGDTVGAAAIVASRLCKKRLRS